MFQRRMFLVASQLRNAQLSPQFRRRKGTQQQKSQEDDHEDDFDNDVEPQQQRSTQRSTIDHQLQSIVRLNKKKYRMSISFVLYVGLGTLFYSLDRNNRQSAILGFYQGTCVSLVMSNFAFFGEVE